MDSVFQILHVAFLLIKNGQPTAALES